MRDDAEDLARWVASWKEAAPELAEIGRRDMRRMKTATAMIALSDVYEAALTTPLAKPISGLVEQQHFFMRLRKK